MTKIPSNKKIYFASDIHLGMYPYDKSKEREKIFVQWLEQIREDAHEIYLLGDVFDFWYEYNKVIPKGFVRFFGKIAEITDSGIPVHFFRGNHDIWAFRYLHEELGITIHKKSLEREFNGKKFYLSHGDGLGKGDILYKMMKWVFTRTFFQWFFSRLHPNFAFFIGHLWSRKSRYAKGIVADDFGGEEKELLIPYSKQLLKTGHYDYFIYGHRHLPMQIQLSADSTFINLGDWITQFTYAVFDGDSTELKSFVDDGKDYRITI